jgi:alpha-L-rhamnosidase
MMWMAVLATGQMPVPPAGSVDPALHARLRSAPPSALSEQFIWTAKDAVAHDPALQAKLRGQDDKTEPHTFRARFRLAAVPANATLYVAGPRAVTVVINGREVMHAEDDGTRPKNLTVMTADAAGALRVGTNVIAIKEVRGHNSLHTGAGPVINQITYGEVLAVKIVPRGLGVDAPPVLVSNARWRSAVGTDAEWMKPDFDDAKWSAVETLGVLGSKEDFLQWNADAGLYAWPGYAGIGSHLRVFDVSAVRPVGAAVAGGTSVTLDFGRELSGRLKLISASGKTVHVLASYGESREEADKGYLGTREIVVPAGMTAYGPKSAFRFVKLVFPNAVTRWKSIGAEAITYPVEYRGSFESSDPTLNRIWATAAYTARLCMQDGIWDAPKRDRGQWMGDLDVTGRTIVDVFGERTLMEHTMSDMIGASPVTRDVNTIAGYSAAWVMGQANFYRHVGDVDYLKSIHQPLLELLDVMDKELTDEGLFTNPEKHKVFVDWSEGFSSDTDESRAATQFEFVLAYREAVYLLNELGDSESAARYEKRYEQMSMTARKRLLDISTDTFGGRWQTNAIAVDSGVTTEAEQKAIWTNVLSHVGEGSAVITPYYGYYVLNAMAILGRRAEALQWMKTYWGGMLAEGATSFWEAYDPHWSKDDFHAHLQADGKIGYYVSLAHGWASGPAAWLPEQVLGIQPTGAGFRDVEIRPDLAGLAWARGGEPTPRGMLRVDVRESCLKVVVPGGTHAIVRPPRGGNAWEVTRNGLRVKLAETSVNGDTTFDVRLPGVYVFRRSSVESRMQESR